VGIAVITIGIDPTIELGPITIAWHGLTIAIGIVTGGLVARREARRRGLDPEPIYTIGLILVVTAIVGSRVYYLAEHGQLLDPASWFGTRGFTFYGGLIAATLGITLYLALRRLSVRYLDAIAVGLPLGIAIGRIGDIINGEHYGPATTFFLGVRNSHPEADVPSHAVAYHSGGLYEVLIGLTVFAIVWPLRRRLRRPTMVVWVVIALLAAGRFVEFFVRSDSATVALGLETAQWTSLALMLFAAAGAWLTSRELSRRDRSAGHLSASASVPRRS
jgi:phosphatidylglycerol---prolipoprotein diacylglyceryl transferase